MDIFLKRKAKNLQAPIYKKLVSGSKPLGLISNNQRKYKAIIFRAQVEGELTKMFLEDSEVMHFVVIISPSGSSKTHAI